MRNHQTPLKCHFHSPRFNYARLYRRYYGFNTWLGNSGRVSKHAHARVHLRACANYARTRSVTRWSRWWKSKASILGKIGIFTMLVKRGKTFPRLSNDVNAEFSSVNHSLAAPQVELPSTSSPRASFMPLHEIQISLGKIDGGIRLDTEIPFPRYFVIGGIEFSNPLFGRAESSIGETSEKHPLFFRIYSLSLYSRTISKGPRFL